METEAMLKLVVGIEVGMGMRVVKTVGNGYKHLSPCSSLSYYDTCMVA